MKRSLFYFLPALICAACMLEGCRKNELQEEPGPQSSEITVGQPEAYPGEGGVFSLLYSIKNPREGVELELTSSEGWISELGADKRMITFTLSENTTITTRKGNIKLSYDGAESVTVEIAQTGGEQSVITIKSQKTEFSWAGGDGYISYSIENPHKGDELQATTEASWITCITVGSSDVSFKVSKNADETSGRTAEILLTYGNAEPAKIVVKQQEFIPAVIEVPETVTLDAFDLKGSFTYRIRNPREGAQLKATSTARISDVTVTGSEITFSILFNANSSTMSSRIYLEYEDAQRVTVTVKQAASNPTWLDGSETANCYIVTEPGVYCFRAVKGNTSESVGTIASVEVLWESFGSDVAPKAGDLIENVVCYRASTVDRIYFRVSTPKSGNAVVAAKDASGKILWSWHIWVTSVMPKDQVYKNGAGTMMECDLGSLREDDFWIHGLYYQYGRKDPFWGNHSCTLDRWEKVASNSITGTESYANEHPTTFITSSDHWLYSGEFGLWTRTKSITDPCPPGYVVPDGGRYGVWATASGRLVGSSWDDRWSPVYNGKGSIMVFYDLGRCYYWPKGYIEGNTGSYSKGGSFSTSYYLSGTTEHTSKKVYVYMVNERGADPCTLCQRVSAGNLLRCMKKQ